MSKNSVWQFATSPSIKFGRGARCALSEQLSRHAVSRVCIVTDATIAGLPLVSELINDIRKAVKHVTVFADCFPEPTVAIAEQACEAAIQAGVDGIVGIGGGSNLDVAKIAATVVQHGGKPRDYFGFDRIPGRVRPMFALPTTAGTGSEVSHSAVLMDTEQAIKVSTLSPWLRPTCAIVDPALTDSCPAKVTAHSGIDALVHAIEAYTNRDFSEMKDVDPQARAYEGSYVFTRLLAAEAIRLIGRSLIPACEPAPVPAARDEMALGAMLAGMAFSNSGVGIVHALEYPLGASTHVGHGEGNGMLLPHVMRYNLPVRIAEYADIARWLGADVVGCSHRAAAEAAIDVVQALIERIGIRTQLRQLGLQRETIPQLAAKAFEIKRLMDVNPQQVELSHLEKILQEAF